MNTVLSSITKSLKYYLGDSNYNVLQCSKRLSPQDIVLYKVDEITYEDKYPRKEAMENVLGSLRLNLNFIYLVVGDGKKVSFYFGLSRDLYSSNKSSKSIDQIGDDLLLRSLESNFRGSKFNRVSGEELHELLDHINSLNCKDYLEGVPGTFEDSETFQGIDRLADAMAGDTFAFIVVATSLPREAVYNIEKDVDEAYTNLAPYERKSIQVSKNTGNTKVNTTTTGTNVTNSHGEQEGETLNHGYTFTEQRSATNIYNEDQQTRTEGTSKTNNENLRTESTSKNKNWSSSNVNNATKGVNISTGESQSSNHNFINKVVQKWLKYIDEVLAKRLDYGAGKGIYIFTMATAAQDSIKELKLKNMVVSLFSGSTGNRVPIGKYNRRPNQERISTIFKFQIPRAEFFKPIDARERCIRVLLSQYAGLNNIYLGNWISSKELSVITGLPQKETIGLPLKQEVEFGLNVNSHISDEKKVVLGNLIQSGKEILNDKVYISKDDFNKHIFVTGVTGSGKTTTCQNLLLQCHMPFFIIEPAKTEYRILKEKYDDLLIFTLGKDKVAPFRLNPFEFFKTESISSRVDMIRASISSAFDMDAAIPQIIEVALYKCYEDCGWDITDDSNSLYDDPFAPGVYAFPTMQELITKSVEIVQQQGFDDRLRAEYIGSIRARLISLLVGSKGLMLNTPRSINFRDLLHRHVVLEMEDIKSTEEKSLIMGFILTNLVEAIKAEFLENPMFKHVTLIEEAHRLFSKYQPGDPLTKKYGVELFSNMLAEVRKYGESLIVADQIPNKLATDVLKNTNTKIVHKIFAQDDKEAIGNTMALDDRQKSFLSSLKIGQAVVFSQDWDKGINCHITPLTNTTSGQHISENNIRKECIDYLNKYWNIGFIPGVDCLSQKPSFEVFTENLGCLSYYKKLEILYNKSIVDRRCPKELPNVCKKLEKVIGRKALSNYIFKRFYYSKGIKEDEKKKKLIVCLLEGLADNKLNFEDYEGLDLLCVKRRI